MNNNDSLELIENYVYRLVNSNNLNPVEIIVKPIIKLSWGTVYGYNTKSYMEGKDENFLVGNIPILFDEINEGITRLGGIITTKHGKKRITMLESLERYRKNHNRELLNQEQYEGIIEETFLGSYQSDIFLWEDFFNEEIFEDLIDAIENYRTLLNDSELVNKKTIAIIYSFIRDLEFKQTKLEIPNGKKIIMSEAQEKLSDLLEKLLWDGIKRYNVMDGKCWYGINKRN